MMKNGLKILIVDDEPQIRRLLLVILEGALYQVLESGTGREAVNLTAAEMPDAVILDLGLPDLSGLEVISRIREWSQVPILVLSVKQGVEDKVAALDAGADDYLTKPFHAEELKARLRAILRHAPAESTLSVLEFGSLKIDLASRLVTLGGKEIHLSATEYALFKLLAENEGKVVTHRQILQTVWGGAPEADLSRLRVFVTFLRKKIEKDPSRPSYIQSEPGIGYRFLNKP